MALTVYSNVLLPDVVVKAGVRGKNKRLNERNVMNTGFQQINVLHDGTEREFEVGFIPMELSAWQAIQALFEVTEGGAYGFLMEDPTDATVTAGVMTSVSSGIYQLKKRYTDAGSSRYKDRIITRPVAAGFVLTNSGVPVVSYTLNVDTGRITIPGAPDAANLAWSGRFYVPVHFQTDMIDWEIERPGSDTSRLVSGPSVVLEEVRE